ncbi:dynein regulatory complex protein 11 [Morphnus guianensis]
MQPRESLLKYFFPLFEILLIEHGSLGFQPCKIPDLEIFCQQCDLLVLLMILLHKVSLKGYLRPTALLNTFHSLEGKVHSVFNFIFLCSSPFKFLRATFHNNIALLESLSLDSTGFAESMLYWYSMVVFHYLSYAFYNNAVSRLLSPCFLPTGEYSYLGTTLRQVDIEPMPSLADVRQLIALYGILPLGSQTVHEKAPLVKALLLAGPAGVGKKTLVHAICTETGANLFNLSASNIAGKYPGKNGLQMMLHMVLKVLCFVYFSPSWFSSSHLLWNKTAGREGFFSVIFLKSKSSLGDPSERGLLCKQLLGQCVHKQSSTIANNFYSLCNLPPSAPFPLSHHTAASDTQKAKVTIRNIRKPQLIIHSLAVPSSVGVSKSEFPHVTVDFITGVSIAIGRVQNVKKPVALLPSCCEPEVAKQLQPSVVWIGETEKIFSKAAPKAEEMNPKRLEKILPKFLKALKAQDRVLLVGTTNHPFDANLKSFCKVYQKIILIPRPDYASRFGKKTGSLRATDPVDHVPEEHSSKGNHIQFRDLATQLYLDYNIAPLSHLITKIMQLYCEVQFHTAFHGGSQGTVLWKHIILQNGGTITNLLNISCLAKVSDGFTQGHIIQAVQAVLSELRLLQMTRKPLRTAEFMTSLARQDPVYKEEEETFKVTLRAMLTGCLSSSPAMSLSRHICSGDLLILLMGWHITI